jgi:hypothetical protein
MIRVHRGLALSAMMFIWFVSGCSDPDSNTNNNKGPVSCNFTVDCPDGQRCEAFVCTEQAKDCTQGSECTYDEYCKAGKCERNGCDTDAECADGAICDTSRALSGGEFAGGCRAGCRATADCGDGQVCNSLGRCEDGGCTTASCSPLVESCDDSSLPARCVPTGKCNGDADCVAYGQSVNDGKDYVCDTETDSCIERPPCVSDSECGLGRICDELLARPACVVGCRDRAGCGLSEVCDPSQRKCVSGCATEADCKLQGNPDQAYVCENLLCVEVCASVDDCSLDGQVCTGSPSICQGCSDSSQCPSTRFCDFTKGSNQAEIDDPARGLCTPLPPDCPADDYGNNHALDRFFTITSFPFVADGAATPQPLFCQDKTAGEWFKITAAPGSVIKASVTYTQQGTNLDLALLTANGTELAASQRSPSTGDTGFEEIRYGVSAGGDFLIQVRGTTTEKNIAYTLSVDVAPPAACTADALEPNNAGVDAAEIMPGTEYTGLQVCDTDRDFYKLNVDLNQIVTVATNARAALGDVDLFVYKLDAGNNLVPVVSSQTRSDSESVQFASTQAGVYIVEVVISQGVGNIDYKLEWNQRPNVCTDTYEPNDACGMSPTLGSGTYPGINLCTDEDWYKVTLLPQQRIVATARYNPRTSQGLVDMRLRGPNDCSFISAYDDRENVMGSTDIQQKIDFTAQQGGTFYLTVSLAQGLNVPYTLEINIIDGPSCQDDTLEGNDSIATATQIDRAAALTGLDNAYVGLRTCDNNEDFFKVTLLEGDEIRWEVKHTVANGDLDAEILKADGTVVATSATTTNDELISYTVPAGEAGVYALRVYPKFPSRTTYRLLTYLNNNGPTDPLCPDAFENNDDRANARALAAGGYTNLSVCGTQRDDDWYKVPLLAGDVLTVTMTHDSAVGNIQLALFDELNTTASPTSQITTTDNIKTLSFTTPRDQTVSLRLLTAASVALSAYSLNISSVSSACVDDALEPNDTSAAARLLDAPGLFPRLNKCEDDEDWYKIVVPAGRRAAVHVNFNSVNRVDFDLQVFSDAAGTTAVAPFSATTNNGLANATPTTIGAETFEWKNETAAAQTYYVRVFTKTRSRQGYDLMTYIDVNGNDKIFNGSVVDVGDGPEDRACPDAYENNDTFNAARPIQLGAVSDLLLCVGSQAGYPGNDPDWYSVFVPAGATLTVNALFSHADGDIDIDVYRGPSATTSLGVGDSVTDNEQVMVTNSAGAESYLIRVQGKNTQTRFSSMYSLNTSLSFATPCTPNSAAGRDKAGAVATTPVALSALSMCEDAEDWYKLTVGANQRVFAGLEVNNRFGDLSLQLINSADVVLATVDASSNLQQLDQLVVAAGTYYLRVYRKGDGFFRTTYDLWLSIGANTPDAPFCPDSYERNDTIGEAASINYATQKLYTGQIMCGADEDWFALGSLSANTEYSLSAFFDAVAGVDVDLAVVGADGVTAAPLTTGTGVTTGNDEHIVVRPTATAQYFLKVSNKAAMPDAGAYNLFVNTKLGACPEDAFEPNNSPAQAKVLPDVSGPVTYGLASCSGANLVQDDYFRIRATTSGPLKVTIQHNPDLVDFLVEFDGNPADESVPGRKTVQINAVANTYYRLYVGNTAANASGPYFLQIED